MDACHGISTTQLSYVYGGCRSAFTRALKQGIRDTYAPVDVIDFGLFLTLLLLDAAAVL